MQQFELELSEEVAAQAKYYEYQDQGAGAPAWCQVLHPSPRLPDTAADDTLSLQSCPVPAAEHCSVQDFSTPHHKRTKSACLPVRPPRLQRPHSHQLPATSSSNYNLNFARPTSTPPPYSSSPFSSRFSLTSSQPSLVPQSPPVPRPKSLYVPFVGCVDAPRAHPGQAARDILHAMSYAPTHDSFTSTDDNQCPVIPPRSKLYKSPKLRSKSSSLVSLISCSASPGVTRKQGVSGPPLSNSTCSLLQFPAHAYSPSHPTNNCENSCLKVTHPPVLHPPPDLVQMTSPVSIKTPYSPQISRISANDNQSSLSMIRESSPYQSS